MVQVRYLMLPTVCDDQLVVQITEQSDVLFPKKGYHCRNRPSNSLGLVETQREKPCIDEPCLQGEAQPSGGWGYRDTIHASKQYKDHRIQSFHLEKFQLDKLIYVL